MNRERDRLASSLHFGLPVIGCFVGIACVSLYPPRSPFDFWPTLSCLSLGLASIGLLVGFLASLWIRKRPSLFVACAAVAIPFFGASAYVAGKGGNGAAAVLCILFGLIAVAVFFTRSMDLVLGFADEPMEERDEKSQRSDTGSD